MNRREMIKISALALSYNSLSKSFGISKYGNYPTLDNANSSHAIPGGWFDKKKYGMFIHWGLYAIPGWHEQHQMRARVSRNEYVKLADQWNPKKFNPVEWLDILQESGMEYLTFTTKHHDGFCLWDTRYTDFNVMNTPYKRDILGMLAEECHKRKVPLSLYYSIVDWNHKNYPNMNRHHELKGPEPGDEPDWDKYMFFLKNQVNELCSNYGEISGFWWDMNVPEFYDRSINEMIRNLQPNVIINDRGFDEGDFGTPERDFNPDSQSTFNKLTEACQSVGMESWGYRKDEDYYTDRHLISSIDRYRARNANYLLNIGPKPSGKLPREGVAKLDRIGKWYNAVKESFEDVTPATDLVINRDVMLTKRENTLYVHLNRPSQGNAILLKPINSLPKKATLLNDGREIESIVRLNPSGHAEGKAYLNLVNLPVNEFCNTVLVIKLEFDDLV